MADIQSVPVAPNPPPFPTLADRPAGTYNAKAYAWAMYWGGEFITRLMALVNNVWNNATAAHERANVAATAANTATTESDAAMSYRNQAGGYATAAAGSASAAADSAVAAGAASAAASKLFLGAKSAPPETDNQGQPLLTGASYFDTRAIAEGGGLKLWSGAAWVAGLVADAGVQSVNGKTGAAITLTAADVGAVSKVPPVGTPLAGGPMDCSLGDGHHFTETVNGSRAFTFTNIPAGAYMCTLELLHLSGTFSLPPGSVWASGTVPPFPTGKRHMLQFVRSQIGSGGWIVSAQTGTAP